ncbi:protein CBFA2T1 [Caerostris extrusa]|uniref:Protein CBFA2T1 n=1 Tax=Caerostris extrusa TaxID=172846 RepID=A0AAV4TLV7_CAEEX|nr:protein CBFA2T1 [Caerostris extrusa]
MKITPFIANHLKPFSPSSHSVGERRNPGKPKPARNAQGVLACYGVREREKLSSTIGEIDLDFDFPANLSAIQLIDQFLAPGGVGSRTLDRGGFGRCGNGVTCGAEHTCHYDIDSRNTSSACTTPMRGCILQLLFLVDEGDITDVIPSDSARMPESPSAVKQHLAAPSSGRSSAPVSSHKASSGMNGSHSPHSTTPAGRTPSPPGTNPSSTAPSVNGPPDLGLGLNVRPLGKLKRFLTTLQQFGADISPDTGERMHTLILGLVSSSLPIEEFHQKVQDLTNYPLRPFVIPFLKANLPLLHAELLHFARLAKQTPQQYIRQHEQLIIESGSHASGEPFEIFQTDVKESAKRRTPPESRSRENGYSDNSSDGPPSAKRQQTLPSPTLGSRMSPAGAPSHMPPSLNFRPYYGSVHRDFPDDRDMEDEWKNIHTMLNCILGMVEKTKRALAILQHRSYSDRQDVAMWRSRHLDGTEFDIKKRAADILPHYKSSEEVRRRPVPEVVVGGRPAPLLPLPEEAVQEVKRQAVAELQKAVSAAETKASELLAAERAKMERMLSDARRQAAEETMAAINHQDESTESCWNCGRKANETCSGCNIARYCGAFCQHKDWENHHRACGTSPSNHASPSSTPPGGKQSPRPDNPHHRRTKNGSQKLTPPHSTCPYQKPRRQVALETYYSKTHSS